MSEHPTPDDDPTPPPDVPAPVPSPDPAPSPQPPPGTPDPGPRAEEDHPLDAGYPDADATLEGAETDEIGRREHHSASEA